MNLAIWGDMPILGPKVYGIGDMYDIDKLELELVATNLKQTTIICIAQEIYLMHHMKNMTPVIYFDKRRRQRLYLFITCNTGTEKL